MDAKTGVIIHRYLYIPIQLTYNHCNSRMVETAMKTPETVEGSAPERRNVSPEGIKARVDAVKRFHRQRNIYKHKCLRCGAEWKGYKPNPTKCKECGDPRWNLPYSRAPEGGEKYGRTQTKKFAPISIDKAMRNGVEAAQLKSGSPSMAAYLEERLKDIGITPVSDSDLQRIKADHRAKQRAGGQ